MSFDKKMGLNTITEELEEFEMSGSEDVIIETESNLYLKERLAGATHMMEIEKNKYKRSQEINQKLQAQVQDLNIDLNQNRQQVQYVTNSNLVLSQEVLRLRAEVEILQATIYNLFLEFYAGYRISLFFVFKDIV
ncbi:hypothetical protein ACMFMF_011799 [Clarireedia jacksonii]